MFKKIKKKLLTILGDIKIFPWPFFVVYHPETFAVKGFHTRRAINVLKPGDIVQRKYKRYLDGFFIPGEFSHTGVYIGDGIVIHAVAEGIVEEDIIDFLRCDDFRILTVTRAYDRKRAVKRCKKWLGTPYDFDFTSNNEAIYCHELAALAYEELEVPKIKSTMMKILKTEAAYLSASFDNNKKIKEVLNKKQIDSKL